MLRAEANARAPLMKPKASPLTSQDRPVEPATTTTLRNSWRPRQGSDPTFRYRRRSWAQVSAGWSVHDVAWASCGVGLVRQASPETEPTVGE